VAEKADGEIPGNLSAAFTTVFVTCAVEDAVFDPDDAVFDPDADE